MPASSRSHARFWLLILGLALFMNLWALGDAPLMQTEPHRALTGHAMVQSGDWFVPRLYGRVYLHKPPLMYWSIAASETITGTANEWTWRLPSAVYAIGLMMLLGWFGQRWFGPIGGLTAAGSFLLMVGLWQQNRSAEIDGINTFMATLCAVSLLEVGFGKARPRVLWMILVALGFAGMLLAKGPTAMALIVGVLLGASLATRTWRWLMRFEVWLGLAAGAIIFGGWALGVWAEIGFATDDHSTAALEELHERLFEPAELLSQLFMPVTMMVVGLPVSLALVALAWPEARRAVLTSPMHRAVAGAALCAILLCMVGMTRPRYGTVTLPMLTLVAAMVAQSWSAGRFAADRPRFVESLLLLLSIGLTIAYLILTTVLTVRGLPLGTMEVVCGVIAVAIVVVAVLAFRAEASGRLAATALLSAALLSVSLGRMENQRRANRDNLQIAAMLEQLVGENGLVLAEDYAQHWPEVLHYGGVNVLRFTDDLVASLPPNEEVWVLLSNKEHQRYQAMIKGAVLESHPVPTRNGDKLLRLTDRPDAAGDTTGVEPEPGT